MTESKELDAYTPGEVVLAEYLDRTDRGECHDRQQLMREHPEAAEELREFFDDLDTIGLALGDTSQPAIGSAAATADGLPRDFGSYLLLEKIGAGGMGEVYKAEHRHMERVVAVKMLHAQLLDSPQAIERFRREVRAAAKLSHPNIVTAHDAGEVQGAHFLAMEYVDGGNFHTLVTQFGPLAVRHAVDYMIQAARGLEFAHGEGVIHRDVKPANLLLDRIGTVKLLDLGLARWETPASRTDATDSESLTQFGQIMGTIDYMSPEQAANTKQAAEPADIYSLGCTLFFLLTGRIVYPGETAVERILAHRESPIPSLRSFRSEVPESLDAVFQRMVAKQLAVRQTSMTEVIEQLEACVPAGERESLPWPSASTDAVRTDANTGCPEAPVGREVDEAPTVSRDDDSSLGTETHPTEMSDRPARLALQTQSRRKRAILTGTLVAAALVAVAWAVVIKIQTRDGTLVVYVSEPGSRVEVLDEEGSVEITRRGANGTLRISVDPGKHRLNVEKQGFQIYTKELTIHSGGTTEITARLEPLRPSATLAGEPEGAPSLAVAPFTAEEAKQHQERWAQHLGVPVEYENSIGMRLRLIPPGEFMMGSTVEQIADLRSFAQQEGRLDFSEEQRITSEGPQHRVRITQPFYVAVHEVTVGQFRAFVQATGYHTEGEADGVGGAGLVPNGFVTRPEFTWRNSGFQQTDRHPVAILNWNDAAAFCRWLSTADGMLCRLPTEAEWEYVCRSGTTTRWYFGDNEEDAGKYAWHSFNGGSHARPVGQRLPNSFGIFDMCGNVREWCSDWYAADYYRSSPAADSGGPPTGTERVARGASFFDLACFSRSACRYHREPIFRIATDGFRPVFFLDQNTGFSKTRSRPPASENPASESHSANGEHPVDAAAILTGHTSGVRAVAFSRDGSRVLSASADGTARLWDAGTGQQLAVLQGHRSVVTDVRFLPDEDRAVTSSDDSVIHLWNLANQGIVRSFNGHTAEVIAIDLTADGRQMVSCGHDPRLRLWDVETGKQIKEFEQSEYSGSWHDVALLPDGRSVLASPGHGTFVVQWDVATRGIVRMMDIKGSWAQLDVSSDGHEFLFGHTTTIGLWNLENDKLEWSQPTRSEFSVPVRFLPDGKRLLALTDDGTVDLMESHRGNRIRRFRGGAKLFYPGLGVSPDGRLAASEGPRHAIILWRIPPPDDQSTDHKSKGTR